MNSQATSFIPQRPTGGNVKNRGVRKIYILAYVSYVLFFGTALAAGLIFFYRISNDRELDVQRNNLTAEKSKFSQSDIESVREMEMRLNEAKDRMNKHISVVSVLEALEHSAVKSVQYVSFDYKRPSDGAPSVNFLGNTDAFDNLLFQREVLAANPILSGAKFGDISLSTTDVKDSGGAIIAGGARSVISFSLKSSVDPSLVGYTPRIPQDVGAVVQQQTIEDTSSGAQQTAPVTGTSTPDNAANQ